jgi:uncharacterized membrane protein YdjX (TVP38/TMEM64 family)
VRRSLLVLVVLLVAYAGGAAVRDRAGVELSVASLQGAVAALGWKAPVAYVGLIVFRQFLLLPSLVVLSVGGICFGAGAATGLGALGIVLSAGMKFGLARGLAPDDVRRRFAPTLARLERVGAVAVGVATAHPVGPMTAAHWAAGMTTIPLGAFLVAVVLAAPVRAFAYAVFGATLAAPDSTRLVVVSIALAGVALLPLLHRGWRRRVFG